MTDTTWTPIGGMPENPGEWSDNAGGYISVARRADGVIRRQFKPHASHGEPSTIYTCDARDQGGPYVPQGVTGFGTDAMALAARR